MRRLSRLLSLAFCAVAAPSAALAHAGHGSGSFVGGLSHPLGGADHVLAMVAVGLWAAQSGGRAVWAAPLAFLAAMLGGGALGMEGLAFPAVEPMILASVIVMGAAVALAKKLRLAFALPVIAVFGIAHGWAHGAEGPVGGLASYATGFAMATAALHGFGIALGFGLSRLKARQSTRMLGGLTVGAGLVLALAG